jgi:asparagine synthase (glutamine-hydrolysing)
MSGIFGLWNLDGRPLDKAILTGMSRSLAHRGSDADESWVDGAVGIGCRLFRVTPASLNERQPHIDSSGIVAVFDGRLDSRQELIDALSHRIECSSALPDVALIASAYKVFGEGFTTYLNGDLALALFDPAKKKLLLARDSLGVRPLYYCRCSSGFLFASEVKALLTHPEVEARPDEEDFAVFLVGNRVVKPGATFFRDISGVVPGHSVTVTQAGIKVCRYWDFDTTRQLNLKSPSEYAEAFRHHFQIAIRRRLRSAYPVAVSLSGGLDSSSIFCTAESMRRDAPTEFPPLEGYSYVSEAGIPSDEIRYVCEIERMYGVSVHRIPMGEPGFLAAAEQEVWHAESPLLDGQWNGTSAYLNAIQRGGSRLRLTGHWADQMLCYEAYLLDLFKTLRWRTIFRHLKEYDYWNSDVPAGYFQRQFLRTLLRLSVPKGLLGPIRELRRMQFPRLQDRWYSSTMLELASRSANQNRSRARFVSSHARSLYEEARSSYHVLCMEWNNKIACAHGLETAFPFLDRDLIGFLMAIPPVFAGSGGVSKGILRSAIQDVVPALLLNRRDKADFTHRVNRGQEREISRLKDLLHSDNCSVRIGWCSPKSSVDIERVVKGIGKSSDSINSFAVRDWTGLELWLRVFRPKSGILPRIRG